MFVQYPGGYRHRASGGYSTSLCPLAFACHISEEKALGVGEDQTWDNGVLSAEAGACLKLVRALHNTPVTWVADSLSQAAITSPSHVYSTQQGLEVAAGRWMRLQ